MLARGVYHTARKVYGRWGYFAVTSRGELFGPYRARHYETDAQLVTMLAAELADVDPVRTLALYREPEVTSPRSTVGALAARTRLLCARALPALLLVPSVLG
jgi:hypothetical protein